MDGQREWQDAAERAEQLQAGAQQGGLMALAGYMVVGAGGPLALRAGARRALTALGNRASSAKLGDQVRTRATASNATSSREHQQALSRAFAGYSSLGDRVRAAANVGAAEARIGGHAFDISRFTSRVGWGAPERLRQEGSAWRAFRASPEVKQQGRLRALLKSPEQRRLLGSAFSEFQREQFTYMPIIYGIDRHAGITGPPQGGRAAYDVFGHAEDFVRWLPTYAGYEVASRGIMAVPGLAKVGAGRLSGALQESEVAAAGVSRAFTGVLNARRKVQQATSRINNTYDQKIRTSPTPVRTALRESAGMLRRADLGKRMEKRAPGRAPQRFEIDTDTGIKGARNIFGDQDLHGDAMYKSLQALDKEASPDALQNIYSTLFIDPTKRGQHQSFLGRLFNAKEVSLGEVEHLATKDATRELARIKQGIDKFQTRVKEGTKIGAFDKRVSDIAGKMDYKDLRVHQFMRIGDKIRRMPTGADVRGLADSALRRATTIRAPGMGQISLYEMTQLQTVMAPRPDAQVLSGSVATKHNLAFFGKSGDRPGHAAAFDYGFLIADKPGSLRGHIFGRSADQGGFSRVTDAGGEFVLSAGGSGSSLIRTILRNRYHSGDALSQERARASEQMRYRTERGESSGPMARFKKALALGDGRSNTLVHRLRGVMGRSSPRKLFQDDGPSLKIRDGDTLRYRRLDEFRGKDQELLADAVYAMQTARARSTNVYMDADVFGTALENIMSADQIQSFGGIKNLLVDDRRAAEAARHVMGIVRSHQADIAVSPTAAHVQKLLNNLSADPNALYTGRGGDRPASVMRRFMFEQGILGVDNAAPTASIRARKQIDELVKRGTLRADMGAEAKAGLAHLDLIKDVPNARISNPYSLLTESIPTQDVPLFKAAHNMLFDRRGAALRPSETFRDLQEFGRHRPRMDFAYRRDSYSLVETYGGPYKEAGIATTTGGMLSLTGLMVQSRFDTTRQALELFGLGWDPHTSMKGIGKIWAARAGTFAGGAFALNAVDAAVQVGVPEGLPFSEGLISEVGHGAAHTRMTASKLYDLTGLQGAASYMEGLMPHSTSTLPGAALGYWFGGWKGAIGGAVLNRMSMETLRDTPFEALSILPPLAPFVSDLTESYDRTRAKYRGDEWTPVRSGRYYLLSTTDFAGNKIDQWRPNWYNLMRGNAKASPSLYGSKFEEVLFKPLPFIDFAVGDLLDPQYLQKKQYHDRPYVAPNVPFREVPFIGPTLGATLGQAYVALHPMASNRPMHMDSVVADFEGTAQDSVMMGGMPEMVGPPQISGRYKSGFVGGAFPGGTRLDSSVSMYTDDPMGAAFLSDGTIVSGTHTRAVLDEQLYRVTQAMGFTGFKIRETMGHGGYFGDDVFESAGFMTSPARTLHDLELGDFMGVGEGMRRLFPFIRKVDQLGPPNTMPDWMPEDYQWGDPYCLLPETLIEIDEHLMRADEAFELVCDNPEQHAATTHRSRLQPILAAARREVDEEVVGIKTPLTNALGTLWITKEHPVLILDHDTRLSYWEYAGNIKPGDILLTPAGPEHSYIPTCKHDPIDQVEGRTPRWRMPANGISSEVIDTLTRLPATKGPKYPTGSLAEEDVFRIEQAFESDGCKYVQKHKREVTNLRRRMMEEGIPREIVGMSAASLRPLVWAWGKTSPKEDGIDIEIDAYQLGLVSDDHVYEPSVDTEEAIRRAAYTLYKALARADTAADLVRTEEGYRLELRGLAAAKYIYTEYERGIHLRKRVNYTGEAPTTLALPTGVDVQRFVLQEVTEVETKPYKGWVYAFEVFKDESFVAAGVATHNSKVRMGEAVLPGAGFEVMGWGTTGQRELNVDEIGVDPYETALNMLGITESRSQMTWVEDMAVQAMLDSGTAIRREAVFVDEASRLAAVASASTQGGQPIHVEALDSAHFRSLRGVRSLDMERLNAMVGAAKRARGYMAYVDAGTGEVQTFVHQFDSGLYNETLQKMTTARALAKEYAAMGYGAPGAMYSTVDRLRVLLNAEPFGDQWRAEMRKAKSLSSAGAFTMQEQDSFQEIVRMHEKMSLPFPMYQERFGGAGGGASMLFNPDPYYFNLSYNENLKAASEYSIAERAVGSVWEKWSNLRTPFHTRVFGAYSVESQYERMVLLGREYQSWGNPIEGFVKPYMRGVVAANDPLQGGLSAGLGGAVFGGPVYGAVGAAAGALYGAGHGLYSRATDYQYVPGSVQKGREVEQAFDRLKYYRAKRLYDATGSRLYLDEMERTAIGWTQAGLSGTGWAKERRPAYGPNIRMDSPLFQGDMGFHSPWQGLRKVADHWRRPLGAYQSTLTSHSARDGALTLGTGVTMGRMTTPPSPQIVAMRAPVTPALATQSPTQLSRPIQPIEGVRSPTERARAVAMPAAEASRVNAHGMQPQGLSKELRAENTQIRSNMGFGSPWRGENPIAAIHWRGYDPTLDVLPPEMYTGFPATPRPERDFLRAMLLTPNPQQQQRLLNMVSPDMASMLDTGWNYLYNQDLYGHARSADPLSHLDMPISSHPVMGMGSYMEGYQIRTLEDLGLDVRESGLGWKSQMTRINNAIVQPGSISQVMNGPGMSAQSDPNVSAERLRAIIIGALVQIGIVAEVDVRATGAPTEIHLIQRT